MVLNFQGGMITNPGDHAKRSREVTAEYSADCRSDEQGWLVPRKGRVLLSDLSDVAAVFEHLGFIFIIQNGQLQWTTTDYADLVFEYLADVIVVATVRGTVTWTPLEDRIFVGGLTKPITIDVSTNTPTIEPFRLPDTPDHLIGSIGATNLGTADDPEIGIRAQALRLDSDGNRVVVAPISDVLNEYHVRPDPADASETTVITIHINVLIPELVNAGVTHIEYWATRIGNPTDDVSDLISLGRISYQVGLTVTRPVGNFFFERFSTYADAGEEVNFQYTAIDNLRCYAAETESNRLYISYYDPVTHERLYQNFTDFDNLELQGGSITGLAFLDETRLVVFATNQIQMYSTDANLSLIQVFEIIAPGTDRGKSIGCISPQSIVDMSSQFYFLAANNYVYRLDERGLKAVSDPVDAVFQTVRKRTDSRGKLLLNHVVAFAYGEQYVISVPISDDSPTHTIVFDLITASWWQDLFGIEYVSKSASERVYGIVEGQLYALYEDETNPVAPVRWTWRNNPYFQHSHAHWDTVHVYALGACEVDVVCSTEQGRVEGTINIAGAGDWFSQRMGVNLRGRFFIIEITTDATVPIDRITVNERIRKR